MNFVKRKYERKTIFSVKNKKKNKNQSVSIFKFMSWDMLLLITMKLNIFIIQINRVLQITLFHSFLKILLVLV